MRKAVRNRTVLLIKNMYPFHRMHGLLTGLLGMLCLGVIGLFVDRHVTPRKEAGDVEVAWAFTPAWPGAIVATPLVTPSHVYVSAIRDAGLSSYGVILCLERQNGRVVWQFDDGGNMQHTGSSPCLDNGRLYVGEGMHANPRCKLYCLDAVAGRKLWDFTAEGHIESSPTVVDGLVYFGAGDDGIYCRQADTGVERWHYASRVHVDSNPAVVNGRLYAGSGLSRRYGTTEVFCLDAHAGKLLWRSPTDLPAWGNPAVDGNQLFIGLGNGRMDRSVEPPGKPAGALLTLETDTGKLSWRYEVADAVLGKPAVNAQQVFFAARDGNCYALERQNGQLSWKASLGSPIVASPVLADGSLYVAASNGRVCCLDSANGSIHWDFDAAHFANLSAKLYASPVVISEGQPGCHSIYVAAELTSALASAPALYCLRVRGPKP